MNEQDQNQTPGQSTPSPEHRSWREERRAERMADLDAGGWRHGSRRNNWIGGVILILLGIVFLLQNMGIAVLTNWWAVFILIPAFSAFAAAWNNYQKDSRLTRRAAGSLTTGILLTILAFIFLLSVDVGQFWPVLLIAGGLALLISGLLPE